MKVILYMAMSANGFIAKENGSTDFVSDIEWDSFRKIVNNTGNLVIGRKTYEVMIGNGEFSNFKDVHVLVISNSKNFKTDTTHHLVVKSPKEALAVLEKERFDKALVAGGGTLNASFMAENLVDEIYIDIEPIIFGKGIRIFSENDFDAKLELIESKKLSDNEIQLHYKVLK